MKRVGRPITAIRYLVHDQPQGEFGWMDSMSPRTRRLVDDKGNVRRIMRRNSESMKGGHQEFRSMKHTCKAVTCHAGQGWNTLMGNVFRDNDRSFHAMVILGRMRKIMGHWLRERQYEIYEERATGHSLIRH